MRLIGVLLLLTATKAGAGEVTAVVDRNRMSPEESALLSVVIPGGSAQVDVSAITDFKVIPQGTSTSVQVINGQVSREARYNYAILPLKEGRLAIPSLTVRMDGKTYQTDPIMISVEQSKEAPEPGEQPLFVEAWVSKTTPFAGQQVIYTFRLYNSVKIANANLQPPDFKGFTSREMERKQPYRKVVNGREYLVTEVSFILVPLAPGRLEIPPTALTCDVVRQRARDPRRFPFDSFFDDPFFSGGTQLEARFLKTRPIEMDVRPLPPDTDAAAFSGLVGRFDLQVNLEPEKLKTGDSAALTIVLAGEGNIMEAEMPDVNIPGGVKVYPDAPREEIKTGPEGYIGTKTFRAALVAVDPGVYRIPPIRIRYFDINAGEYKTLESRSVSLEVLPGEKREELEVYGPQSRESSNRIRKHRVEFSERDILPLKDDLGAVENRSVFPLHLFLAFLLIPAALSVSATALLRYARRDRKPSEMMAFRARNALKAAGAKKHSHGECLAHLHKALMAAVFSKAGIQGEAATYDEIRTMLKQAALASETIDQTISLLKRIDSLRYGGMAGNAGEQDRLHEQTRTVVRRLIA